MDRISKDKKIISRRDFLRIGCIFSMDVVLGALVGWNYVDKVEPALVETSHVHLTLPNLPESFSGFKIVQISDIHIGPWMTADRFTSIVEMVKEQSPDLVAITGDMILSYDNMPNEQPALSDFVEALKNLTSEYSTVAVLGNHDYWYNAFIIREVLEEAGAKVLRNSHMSLERNGDYFHIAGVDDVYEGHDDLARLLANLPKEGGAMLLAHEPDFADISAVTGRFDLQISGHSHGGQVVLPIVGPPILPYLGNKYPSGLYKVRDMYQYTNRGVGMTAPFVRFNCRPEITVFTLESV